MTARAPAWGAPSRDIAQDKGGCAMRRTMSSHPSLLVAVLMPLVWPSESAGPDAPAACLME